MICFLTLLLIVTEISASPSFKIEFTIKENAIIGTILGNIFTKLTLFQNVTKLEILKNDFGFESYFTLERETGNLVVRSLIDRETICENNKDDDCIIPLLVDTDTDVIQMKIKVEDVNDNPPTFLSTQKIIQIQENIQMGMTYFLPVAQDKDTSKYGVSNYSISSFRKIDNKQRESYSSKDRYFRIEESNVPMLQVVGKIDREEVSSFVFIFVASDFGHRTGSCTVTVVVTDVNDNSPEWKKDNYKVRIKECQQQGEILEFDAVDKDDPNTSNGRVSYRFSDRTKDIEKIKQIFYINDNKLSLSNNRPSELSSTGFLTMFIIAADGNGRMKETSVQIIVEDCNDHPPIISITARYSQIFENMKEKKSLSTVSVKDSDRGRNGIFDCVLNDTSILSLVKKHIDMSQNQIIYKIETNGDYSFDRETMAVYTVEIQCADQGENSLSSTQRFSINIIDVNDNAPKFEDRTFVFHIMENNAIGSAVGQVKAIDPDSGINGHIRYSILGGNEYFTITVYGEIQTKIKFDREYRDNYEFTLAAYDSGNPPLNDTMAIKVYVIDMNDCPPVFVEEYIFKVIESYGDIFKNERIGEVKATDKDFGINGTVNYKLVKIRPGREESSTLLKQQLQRLIRVSSDGGISISGNLDRESIHSIQLTVEAFDNGIPRLSTSTTVSIEVLDLNDNAPVFRFPNNFNKYLNICLEVDIGSQVGLISAEDRDQGLNGTVNFEFIGADKMFSLPFKLESDGKVTVTQELNQFSKNRRLPDKILVRSFDLGTPQKSTTNQLFLNYYSNTGRKSTDSSNNIFFGKINKKAKPYNDNSYSNSHLSDGMMLLYCLAAILFFVFIVVFSVLLYLYCSKTYSNSERYSKKHYKSSNSPISSNPCLKELQQMNLSTGDFHSVKNQGGAAVCFLNDDGSSYTHLMMLNNNKYTPMCHPKSNFQHQEDFPQADILSVSQNYLDSSITNAQFQSTSPLITTKSMKKFSLPNNTDPSIINNCQNYSTLQDKSHFNTLDRNQSILTLSSGGKQYGIEGIDFSKQQKEFSYPLVTSSFV